LEAATAYGDCAECENNINKAIPVQSITHGRSPNIALITDAPTANGRLLSVKTEDVMAEILELAELSWEDVYMFAAFRCPLGYIGEGMANNVTYCRGRARRILGVIRPKGVLLMGRLSASFFGAGEKDFTIPVASPQKAVYRVSARTSYHPNYYFMSGRNSAVKEAIAADLRSIATKAGKSGKRQE
jgi:uracil-DNA glycosylase